uniref:Radical SAM protein n=1 Tax=Heterorhabditis bacteriophora TaxID=37862 RepID=A0A1I7XD63_HETBA
MNKTRINRENKWKSAKVVLQGSPEDCGACGGCKYEIVEIWRTVDVWASGRTLVRIVNEMSHR